MNDDALTDGQAQAETSSEAKARDALRSIGEMSLDDEPAAVPEAAEGYDDLAPAQRSPYVRQRPPRRTQEAIDDLADSEGEVEYSNESNIVVGGMLSDRSYRRAHSQISHVQRNSRYGQYLEIPKGRRSIFVKRERTRRRNAAIAAIAVLAMLAAAAYLVWQIMSNLSFG